MNDTPIGRVRSLQQSPAAPAKPEPANTVGGASAPPPSRPRDRDEFDEAMESRARKPAAPIDQGIPLKRTWDDDLEAELTEALAGFDEASYEVGKGKRTRAEDRAHVPKGAVGGESRERGPQQAKVVAIKEKSVFVDMGAKSEGVLPLAQFGEKPPSVGEMIDVYFERFDPKEGLLRVNLKGAAVEANWDNLREGVVVEARATKVVKGGLEVDVNGIRGFLPISHVDLVRVEDGSEYINQKFRAVVTEARQREKNLVISRRDLLNRERQELREKTWAELEVGQTRKGKIRSIQPFGAFVDLGGVDGLIALPELAWGRVKDPSEVVKLGDEVEVKVIRIDADARKVGLSLKQIKASPWDNVEDDFFVGKTYPGVVTKLMDFGAFVELAPGIEGLVHISELGPKKVFRVKDVVQEGQTIDVRVLKLDPEQRKMSLSLRPDPAAQAPPEPEKDDDETNVDEPPAPKPERKIPLKGGLGDRDRDPFVNFPKAPSGWSPPSTSEE